MPMSFRTSAKNYRNLLQQINSLETVIREVNRLMAWKPDRDIPAMSNFQRGKLGKARDTLKEVKRGYEDIEGLCRPVDGFAEDNGCVDRVDHRASEAYERVKKEMRRCVERELAALKEEIDLR